MHSLHDALEGVFAGAPIGQFEQGFELFSTVVTQLIHIAIILATTEISDESDYENVTEFVLATSNDTWVMDGREVRCCFHWRCLTRQS
jgi:hypothetical protein